jgi:hypothetical protein
LSVFRLKTISSEFILAFLVLVVFTTFDCAPKPRLLPENRTPQNVLRCALENKLEFETLACLMDLKLKGKEAKFGGTVEFFYMQPKTFSLYPRTLFGVDRLVVKGEDDSLTIYFPKQNEFYRGSFSDFEKTGLWSWKISLRVLLDEILAGGGMMDEDARYAGNGKDMFLYKSEDEDWIKEFWIDSRRCRLIQSRWVKKSDGESYRIEYGNFSMLNHVDVPKIVNIITATGESARIKFLERKFDLSIPVKKF